MFVPFQIPYQHHRVMLNYSNPLQFSQNGNTPKVLANKIREQNPVKQSTNNTTIQTSAPIKQMNANQGNLTVEKQQDCRVVKQQNLTVEKQQDCRVIKQQNLAVEKQQDYKVVKPQNLTVKKQPDCRVVKQMNLKQEDSKSQIPPSSSSNNDLSIGNFQHTNMYMNASVSVSPPQSAIERPAQLDLPPYVMMAANKQAAAGKPLRKMPGHDNFFDSDEDAERVPVEVRKNLRNLIRKHSEGIWCRELPRVYA